MMDVSQAKLLKELEKEWSAATSPDRRSARQQGEAWPRQGARLKRIVADQVLGMEMLQEALEKRL